MSILSNYLLLRKYIAQKIHINDIKLYVFHLFIGPNKGLDQIVIDQTNKDDFKYQKSKNVFNENVISLSAYSVEVGMSCGHNGLIYGSMWNDRSILKINENRVNLNSFRTSWMGNNIVNYSSKNDFTFMINKTEKAEDRKFRYSNNDEDTIKIKITNFAHKKIEKDTIINEDNKTNFIFNSTKKYFQITNDKRIITTSLLKDSNIKYRGSTRKHEYKLPKLPKETLIDTKIMRDGIILEYFNSVLLFKNEKIQELTKNSVYSCRSYAGSFRYRNLITLTHTEGLEMICIK